MVAAGREICSEKGFNTDDLYIFLDFLSIPQKNVNLRLAAINTLGIISSLAPYFVVIAPTSVHKDTKKVVNKASYSRRGLRGHVARTSASLLSNQNRHAP